MKILRKFPKFIALTALVYSLGVVNITPPESSNNGLTSFNTGMDSLFKTVSADILTGDAL